MSSNYFSKGSAVISVTGVDFSTSLGLAVKFTAGVPAVNDSATVPAAAVVLDGAIAARQTTAGILGGLSDPVLVKIAAASAALKQGDRIMQAADGTYTKDVGPGTARVVVGVIADPAGAVAGDLVAAQLFAPMILP